MTQQKLITFQLGEQVLGLDIMTIREIRAWSPTTPLPNVPAHLQGVVNLRGIVLPVFDLRERIGWGRTNPSSRNVIIVVQIGSQMQGVVVDAVNDIVEIDRDDLQPPPDVGGASGGIIEGIATVGDRMVMVLAANRLTSPLTHPLAA